MPLPIPSLAQIAELPTLYQATIPEAWLDDMLHMNVMWYTHLFSEGTVELFRKLGLDLKYFESNQRGWFALENHIRYISEVRVGKHVSIRTRLLARSEKRLHFMHFLMNDDDNVLSTIAEFVSAHIDMKVRRMAPIPAETAAEFDRILAEHLNLDWPAPVCGVMRP
jgi:acyl-CoA thioester hydrolase